MGGAHNRYERYEAGQTHQPPGLRHGAERRDDQIGDAEEGGAPADGDASGSCVAADSAKQAEDPDRREEGSPERTEVLAGPLLNPPPVVVTPVQGVKVEGAERQHDEFVGGHRKVGIQTARARRCGSRQEWPAAMDAGGCRVGNILRAVGTGNQGHDLPELLLSWPCDALAPNQQREPGVLTSSLRRFSLSWPRGGELLVVSGER